MIKIEQIQDDNGELEQFTDVTVNITAPLYWWLEFGATSDLCSPMHKLLEKPLDIEDFSFDGAGVVISKSDVLEDIFDILNSGREAYLGFDEFKAQGELQEDIDSKKQVWYAILSLLPLGYNQKRTARLGYQELSHIYHTKKNNELDEWNEFCSWIERLPRFEEIECDK